MKNKYDETAEMYVGSRKKVTFLLNFNQNTNMSTNASRSEH
jgi:hypothetical protein